MKSMNNESKEILRELLTLAQQHAKIEGIGDTAIPDLKVIKSSVVTDKIPNVYKPSLCIILQGSKDVILGEDIYSYSPGEFIVTTVDLPVSGSIKGASKKNPYYCLMLEFDSSMIFDVLKDFSTPSARSNAKRGIFVGEVGDELMEAFVRLMKCLNRPADIKVLSPMIIREIIYRLLTSKYGEAVQQLGVVGSQVQRIAKIIDSIKTDFAKTLRMESLAQDSGMSLASFHKYFKEVTSMSPLQYQKQIRLQEARRILMDGDQDAATVSFEVGYESPSQFSREYARMFGLPPKADMKKFKR